MSLTFLEVKKPEEIKEVYDYNIDAFSESPDFEWSLDGLKSQIKDGWKIFAVKDKKNVIAAAFVKNTNQTLLTKNTALKMDSQGSGFSHDIKEFFEKEAKSLKAKKIFHYCRIDNFRTYSLNESHKYKKTDRKLGPNGHIVEWVKEI